jgi:hypothetical protein
MRNSYDADRGVTYISARALGIGFALYCVGFLLLLFGANWVSEWNESRETAAATVGTSVPALSAPAHRTATSTALCAPAPPCVPRAAHKPGPGLPAGPPAVKPASVRPTAVAPVVPPGGNIGSQPAHRPSGRTAGRNSRAIPAASPLPETAPARAAAPATGVGKPAMRAATPAARATTPAGLLVPFTSAPGLMPGGGSLDPRSASHAPLVVAPTTTLGPAAEPSEPPAAGGGLQPRRR